MVTHITPKFSFIKDLHLYEFPQTVSYEQTTDTYILPGGWQTVKKTATVIGDNTQLMVTEIIHSELPIWLGPFRARKYTCIALGFHKSRLTDNQHSQLNLF